MNLSFERVAALWGLLLLPALVIIYAIDGQIRRRTLERLGHLPQIRRMIASLSPGARRFKAVLTVAAIACGVVALAGPEVPGRAHIAPRRGLDIVVALDFSKSMLANDVYPTRMERAKAELGRLLDGLKGDRVGLVAFSGVTLSYPLTDDYAAAKLFWRDLSPADIPVGGSDIGLAVREALSLLESGRRVQGDGTDGAHGRRGQRRPAQVIILLSDGDDTEGTALGAAREAAARGVKVMSVGIGSRRGELVKLAARPDGTAEYLMDAAGKPVRMVLDATTLQQVASLTGGDYFEVDGVQPGMERVARTIADLERVEEEARVVKEPEEIAWPFLLAAVLLLVLDACIRERRRVRKVPGAGAAAGAGEKPEAGGAAARPKGQGQGQGQGMAAGAQLVLLAALLPVLSGFSFLERASPDVEEGNRQLMRGNAQAALQSYERALGAYPDDLRIHYNRGAALLALGRRPEAEREFLLGTQSPDGTLRADSFYNLGNALLQQSRLKEAIDAYKRSLILRPGDRHAKWNLELALRKLREQEEEKKQKEQQQKQEQQAQSGQQQQDPSQQQQDPSAQPSPAGTGRDAGTGANRPDQPQQNQQPNPLQQNQQQQNQQQQDQQQANPQQQNPQQQNQPQQGPSPDPRNPNGRPEAPPPSSASPGTAGQGQGQQGQAAVRTPGAATPRDTERQDAEAVLDAFEAVEPTVQKDLARRRAGNRRPRKDW